MKFKIVHWARTNWSPPWCSQTGYDFLVSPVPEYVTCKKCKKMLRKAKMI